MNRLLIILLTSILGACATPALKNLSLKTLKSLNLSRNDKIAI